jgi:hypothetical protein
MNLIERVKAILLTPKTEWPVIEREPGDAAYLFTNYVAILAAIPVVCGFIGMSLIGFATPVGTMRIGIVNGLVWAVLQYLLSFVMVYVTAFIIDALAPTFGGRKNFDNALRLSAYSPTPFWILGVFVLIPALGFLQILGLLYGFYLLWIGLPSLMNAPQDKSLIYTAAIVVPAIVIYVVIVVLLGSIIGLPRMM